MGTVDNINYKINIKFNILTEICDYFVSKLKSYNNIEIDGSSKHIESVEELKNKIQDFYDTYNSTTSSILYKYYLSEDKYVSNCLAKKYQQLLIYDNYNNKLDHFMHLIEINIKKYVLNDVFNKIVSDYKSNILNQEIINKYDFKNIILKYMECFNENKIILNVYNESDEICECGGKFIINNMGIFKTCEICGQEIYIPGTVIDDPMISKIKTNKSKKI